MSTTKKLELIEFPQDNALWDEFHQLFADIYRPSGIPSEYLYDPTEYNRSTAEATLRLCFGQRR